MSKQRSASTQHKRIYNNCCSKTPCSPGIINVLAYGYGSGSGNNLIVSWDALPGATSYIVTTTSEPGFPATITRSSLTTANIDYVPDHFTEETVTITAITVCGNTSATQLVYPCFLAGSLVHMAGGGTKAIEDVLVHDLVIGAFGEINRVLALHRPILGSAKMCKINDEHSTTNHHPHVSLDRKFYCGDPDLVSGSTYGHKHEVIDENGIVVERMLDGLARERIRKLDVGIELKTIEGSRMTQTIEVYSMSEYTQLYNLVIDGSHTYHVDGYSVTGWPSELDFDYDSWTPK
jgi:hypothetical protein